MQSLVITLLSIFLIWLNPTIKDESSCSEIIEQNKTILLHSELNDTIDYTQLRASEDGFYFYENNEWIFTFDVNKKLLFKINKGENWNQVYPAGEDLFVFIDGNSGKTGFLNIEGKIIIPTIYESSPGMQPHFYEGICSVIDESLHQYIFINNKGERIMEIPSQELMGGAGSYRFPDFHEGLCISKKNGKFGYIDKKGSWMIPPKFDRAERFSEGLAAVRIKGRVIFIDHNGNQAISRSFGAIDEGSSGFGYGFFKNGKMIVNVDTSQMHIDPTNYDGPLQHDFSRDVQAEINKQGQIIRFVTE